ncbi:MAG: polysaccharide pyruvyl transferase family protein [Chloroflexi bacterium]|nr:polysaccharide pyruvyl transferase family protein [Chloroflexota bacterium]
MKKITVWGTSFKKVADEAQLLSHYKIIKTFCPEAQVTFISQPHHEIRNRFPEIHIVPFAQLGQAITKLLQSQLLVIGGGPFYEEILQMLKCALLILTARLFRIPVLVYGVTVFPIKLWWAKLGYRWILNQADAIHVRDQVAAKSLSDIGLNPPKVHAGGDPRLILDLDADDHIQSILASEGIHPPFIALTTRHIHKDVPAWVKRAHGFDEASIEKSNRVMARVVDSLSELGQVVLIPMHPDLDEDSETAHYIRQQMREPEKLKILSRRYLSSEVLGILRAADMLFAGRLGSALFCSMTRTPVMAIAYEERMNEVMNELGLGDYVSDWRRLDYEKMISQSKRLRASRAEVSKSLMAKSDDLRRQAWQDAELYKKFLA